MVDGALGYDETLGDLRIAQTVGDEHQYLELARREPSGVFPRAWTGAAWDGPCAERAQLRGRDVRRRRRVEILERGQSATERIFLSTQECKRGLVWAVDSGPALARRGPVAGHLQSVLRFAGVRTQVISTRAPA